MTIRETAIENAEALAQQIFEATYVSDSNRAYYVERSGTITVDDFKRDFTERQSVQADTADCAARLFTVPACPHYKGKQTDFRELDYIGRESDKLPPGRQNGDVLDQDNSALTDEQYEIASNFEALIWENGKWHCLAEVSAWEDRTGINPADPLVEAIEELPLGWFPDEQAEQNAA